jgi:peptide/nickel transport system permease protein
MPSFWVAMLLMLILAVHLRLFPVSGVGVKNIVLPAMTLAFFQMAVLLRLVRSDAVVLGTRGGAAHTDVGEHALRRAWLPECRLMDDYLPRDRHCPGGVGRQLHGR